MMALQAAQLFDGERFHEGAAVEIDGACIRELVPNYRNAVTLPADWLVVPGFVDLQVNGAGGVLFNDHPSVGSLRAISLALASVGTTAFLPTLISAREKIAPALAAARTTIDSGLGGVLGVHIEGPFVNPARRGAHPAGAIVSMQDEDVTLLAAPHPGVRLLTLAPEMVEQAQLTQLAQSGVRVFIGHTDATFEQANTALQSGAVGFTHLFNAMSQFGSRAPGCVGAALAHDGCCAGIICDGLHVHRAAISIAHAALGAERLFLVSDAMPTAASDRTSFRWDGETIKLVDGRLSKQDGTLAGAHLTMAEAVARAVTLCGIPLANALRMATSTPADQARSASVGRIAPGRRADLVALDAELRVAAVWQAGQRIV